MNFDLVWIYKNIRTRFFLFTYWKCNSFCHVISSSKYQGCLSEQTRTLIFKTSFYSPKRTLVQALHYHYDDLGTTRTQDLRLPNPIIFGCIIHSHVILVFMTVCSGTAITWQPLSTGDARLLQNASNAPILSFNRGLTPVTQN